MVLTGLLVLGIGTVTIVSLRRPAAEGKLPLVVGSAVSSATGTASTAASPAPSAAGGSASTDPTGTAAEILDGCRTEVRAADDVREAAERGVGHWAAHVRAQTDADADRITVAEMDAIFARTKEAGPDDVRRYRRALARHDDSEGSCRADQEGAEPVARQLRRCAERAEEQQPVLEAAAAAMDDWSDHLREMRRSRSGKIHDPQQTWRERWRAAPPHIEAHRKAERQFSAPRC